MKLFTPLYERVMRWVAHPRATHYLAALSFAESSFFPIPPDVMLAPMAAAKPNKSLHFALITTLASVAGGMMGYLIGWWALDSILPWLHTTHYWSGYLEARRWFSEWGVWVVFLAGFSPVPYKLFTITAGALTLSFPLFLAASLVGRGARFFLVGALVGWAGPRLEPIVRQYVEWLGWASVVLLVGVLTWLQFRN